MGSCDSVAPGPSFAAISCLAVALCFAGAGVAQPPEEEQVTLAVRPVRASVSMIEGVGGFAGGNVGVSIGKDGVFLIDDELAQMSPKLIAALGALSPQSPRFVINTHWHGDHSGGNPALGAKGAVIIAHGRVRERLSAAALKERAQPAGAEVPGLPIVTFERDVTLHLNGDTILVFHVPPAHTDGDSVVYFKQANVIHTGDLFLARGYPFVDLGSGGNFEGFIGAAKRILALCNDQTRLIPGHGEIVGRDQLVVWLEVLSAVRDRVQALIDEGKSLEEAVAAKPTADLDGRMGANFISPDKIVEAAYRSMTGVRD